MNRSFSVALVAVATVSLAALAGACKDDATIDNDAPLPGPGPVGMGGSSAAGSGGAGGAAGSAGGAGTAGAAGSGAGAAGAAGSGASSKVRFGNLSPGGMPVDFCAKPAGGAAFIGPVFKLGGGQPLPYPAVSPLIDIPLAGMVEVKAVTGDDCAAAGPTTTGMLGGANYTVIKVGGAAGAAEAVSVLTETTMVKSGSVALRFVHAIAGSGAVDVGLADKPTMKLTPPAVFSNVPFGGVSGAMPAGAFPVDANGYATVSALPVAVGVGAAPAGSTDVVFVAEVLIGPANSFLTAYGVGAVGDASNPIGALLCNDTTGACMMVQ